MRIKHIISIAAIVALIVSCARRVETGYEAIPLVDRLVTDSLPSLQKMASSAGQPSGAIVLIGDPLNCLAVSEKMMVCDEFDNVDARQLHDGLQDFAGETVISFLNFIEPLDTMAVREAAIKSALAAIDSSVNCKLLVICSPGMALKGGDDISDLFGKIGCDVPVISSTDTSFQFTSECFKVMRERNMFTHDIAYPAACMMMLVPDQTKGWFTAIDFDESLVPESFADTVGVFAPNTYVSHVQNKYNSGRNR